ncbi:internal protein B [Bordetella phage vB_BbrP_BB8]|uniref:Internal protein B n=1 Tax=Bordetella phage vB_BbrP_BB8 TaxID=2587820 RepID=A0A4Y5TPY5_9CAUD|nr:internal protein B [Bordetella phage vB_BbrP_BB8]
MCGPAAIPLATLAISAVSTVFTVVSQQNQAQAAADAQNAFNRQQEQNALVARNANLANLEVERNTALDDTREQINQNTMALRRAQATARVSAGEAGVSGLSVDALLRDLAGQAGYDNATAVENYMRQDADINARRENTQNSYTSGLNSIRQTQIQSPDYLGAALRIGQAGLKSYADYEDRRDRLKNPQTK